MATVTLQAGRIALVSVAYCAAALTAIEVSLWDGDVAPVWVASGIALAAVNQWGRWMAVGALLGEFAAGIVHEAGLGLAIGAAVGSSLEPLVALAVLQRFGVVRRTDRVPHVIGLVVASFAGGCVSATIAVSSLLLANQIDSGDIVYLWLRFVASVVVGTTLVTPFLLTWLRKDGLRVSRSALVEAALLAAALVGVSWIGLMLRPVEGSLLLLLFPLMVWSTLRFGFHGATGSIVLVSVVAAGAIYQNGRTIAGLSQAATVQALQGLLTVAVITNMLLAALLQERDAAKERMRRTAERLEHAQEIAHLGSWEWELGVESGLIWSDELVRLLGVDPTIEPANLETLVAHVHPDDREDLRRGISSAIVNGTRFSVEHRVRGPHGSERVLLHAGQVINDESPRIIATALDITKQRSLDHLRDALIATASHELRTPLTSVIGFANTLDLRWDAISEEQRREMVRIIEQQGVRLSSIVDDTLMQSRLDSGSMTVHRTKVDLASILELARTTLVDGGEDIDVRCPPGTMCAGSHDHMLRIVTNLLTNALKYGAPPIIVDVDTTSDPDWVEVRVIDHGAGVPASVEGDLFERFVRGTGTDHLPGTGLGLSIVRGLTEAAGGTVSYRREGGETIFAVRLRPWRDPGRDEGPGIPPPREDRAAASPYRAV